ncbi:MAG: glucokinase [Zymomonas mobilis subsp. pomaceae]|uniref:Glucokinase n=1 Tax=Zymomonas mobilis subsp. pomaceae (strain ATCC 29192 / DSM 22645 / JCM 10191 / CCUG 17912 / NBRC 13757 / NCIMB 11200 / NRRL B-4491 / Barker I) TaxID=579138 RepID=F8ESF5_ZYMMT|nr:glucokinase [Zymomonas mobilis]AEI37730.1 glucokinase [Zymomonas mobilis subsp. pomaceae ATCC 29192]MDX5949097.1 glucokinase [Zymomonas mobilis subsp. pomaceae]GEB88904.1 glucokinase [Zymomonas mobilis subsp. pomaceae]
MEIVAIDIGGTHARFALAEVSGGKVVSLGTETTFKTAEHASLQLAWERFGEKLGRPLPRAAAIAFAGPVHGEVLKLTNNPWVLRPATLNEKLNVDSHILINDFGAVAHAVAHMDASYLGHICGPDEALPAEGVITILGPGTGLGVAHLLRTEGRYFVIETEGGHIDFAPLDKLEDKVLARLRERFRRVSIERIVSGPGLGNIYEALAAIEGVPFSLLDDVKLWQMALEGKDNLAEAALDRFCLSLGAIAGDLALAQGASGVAIGGGVGLRIAGHLPGSGFRQRFVSKGRFERVMSKIPVKLITYPQPGLLGAAAAYANKYSDVE